ncbi:sigma factor G inhibitor Gin [Halobacillus sp. MO56]
MKTINRCGICDRNTTEGIHIYQLFICESCEKEILETEPGDARYSFYIDKLKNITPTKIHS